MLPAFGWPKLEGAEAAERGEDDPDETDGIGDSPGDKIFLLLYYTWNTKVMLNTTISPLNCQTVFCNEDYERCKSLLIYNPLELVRELSYLWQNSHCTDFCLAHRKDPSPVIVHLKLVA